MTMQMFQQVANLNYVGDDSDFRTFVGNYRAALTAAGLVRTSDTGQINPSTVAKPPGTNLVAGYEIWRFNDSAQATQPIFFKLEYGFGTGLGRISLWTTIGTGSDGAGNITGVRQARQQNSIGSQGSVVADTWVSGGDGYVSSGVFVHSSLSSYSLGWMIERFRLPNGTVDTSTLGAGFVYAANNGWCAYSYDGIASEALGNWPALSNGTSFTYRGVTYAYPYYPVLGPVRAACRGAVAVNPSDAGYSAAFTVTLYGAPHVFRGVVVGSSYYGRGSLSGFALRYE